MDERNGLSYNREWKDNNTQRGAWPQPSAA